MNMVEVGNRSGTGGSFVKTSFEHEPSSLPVRIMGPFRYFIRLSGFDCSRASKEHIKSFCGILSIIIAIPICLILLLRAMILMGVTATVLEASWAESNVYGFISLQMFNAAVCVVCWTRDNFVPEFEERLGKLKKLRLTNDPKIDNYTRYHLKAIFLIIPIFGVILATSITAAVQNRYAKDDNSTFHSTNPIFMVAPVIDLFGCLSTSLSLVLFVTINVSLVRELELFNKELSNSAKFQQLILPNVMNCYSKRHSEIIQLVKFANKNLNMYSAIIPLFTIVSSANAVYILMNFFGRMQLLYFILMVGWAIISFGITIGCFASCANVQDKIKETAEILMHDEVLQSLGNDQMHNTYRVLLDRCLYSNSKCSLIFAFSINSQFFYRVLVITPNIATLMTFYRKTLVLGGH